MEGRVVRRGMAIEQVPNNRQALECPCSTDDIMRLYMPINLDASIPFDIWKQSCSCAIFIYILIDIVPEPRELCIIVLRTPEVSTQRSAVKTVVPGTSNTAHTALKILLHCFPLSANV